MSALRALYSGDGGQSRFMPEDACSSRSAFVLARTKTRAPLGCGAFRRYNFGAAELQRIFCRVEGQGVGSAILRMLETEALATGL